ncbi:MAG TPA: DNA-processing protein DprA [Acidimicrobiia bacterium]|nr:DNA-processing protein DprA [Acidimicrobiia bacterium]
MSDTLRVRRGEEAYPALLETISDPPPAVWIRGRLPAGPGVAIVGTRRATRYGLGLARSMGAAVARAGWPVVSGLARGVDGAAHRGCLDAAGSGVAVLGSGIDVWYPPEHQGLGQDLVRQGGAVVSEYPPGTSPEPWRFPARNRIISALSAVVVVTEAAVKGGALITARLAAEQGREVFAVPGDVSRSTSVGTNLLIRDGALPILGPEDLLEALSLVMGPPPVRAIEPQPLEIDVPPAGASVEMVVEANGGDTARILAILGRLESEGRVRIEGGEVVRIT